MNTIVEAMICATRLSPAALPDASSIEKAVADGAYDFAQIAEKSICGRLRSPHVYRSGCPGWWPVPYAPWSA